MGGQVSVAAVNANPFLRAVRDKSVPNDSISWGHETDGLPALPKFFPTALSDSSIYSALTDCVQDIVAHSRETHRVGLITKHICGFVDGLRSNRPDQVPYPTICNYILFLQHLLRAAFDCTAGEADELQYLCAVPDAKKTGEAVALALETAVAFLTEHPIENRNTPCLSCHAEMLGLLTVCCSSPLYHSPGGQLSGEGPEEGIAMLAHHPAIAKLTRSLLNLVSEAEFGYERSPSYGHVALLTHLILEATSIFIPSVIMKQLDSSQQRNHHSLSVHLGRRACHLLNILTFYRKNLAATNPTPFLTAFRGGDGRHPVAAVFAAMCRPRALENMEMVLLLYSLLNEDQQFLEYTLCCTEIERLVVPLLEGLADQERVWRNPANLYVVLTIFLILSQYPNFNNGSHTRKVPVVSFCKERVLRDISAGSLLIVVLVRVIQHNITYSKDLYVTRQALSILSNTAGAIYNIHGYAAQKLVLLALVFSKKVLRLHHPDSDEAGCLLEFLRLSLGCINLCLTTALTCNLQLVYELLHQKKAFSDIKNITEVSEYYQSINTIMSFFEEQLSHHEQDGSINTVEAAMQVLQEATSRWDETQVAVLPHDRFAYAEETSPEGFFAPHLWDMVIEYYCTPAQASAWDSSKLALFTKMTACDPPTSPSELLL